MMEGICSYRVVSATDLVHDDLIRRDNPFSGGLHIHGIRLSTQKSLC